MGKVITVWGSPGSGKSMFSCILAKALTRDKRKAIIINAEISVPMLPVWLPEQIIQTNASVGQVLSSVEIDTSLVAGHVTVLKSYPFIGVMGYPSGILVIWSAKRTFNSYSVPNAAMCELKIARKYSRIFATIPASANQP